MQYDRGAYTKYPGEQPTVSVIVLHVDMYDIKIAGNAYKSQECIFIKSVFSIQTGHFNAWVELVRQCS
ncbi:MAG: hypothetical protein KA138_00320, partial [Saprospiraceae bacterium]|nr:hypothetical protein [Saprospiraceae bacterium]